MIFIKTFILLLIFIGSLNAGKIIAKKYSNRVQELRDMKNALNMFLTKIKFTYEAIPVSFSEIGNNINGNIGKIFKVASENMKEKSAGEAWEEVIDKSQSCLTSEDKDIIKRIGKITRKNRFRWSGKWNKTCTKLFNNTNWYSWKGKRKKWETV